MSNQDDESTGPMCPECSGLFMPWITTCPQCDVPLANEMEQRTLAEEVAPVVASPASWLDIPVSSDEPVKVALLTHFLNEREIPFESSRRFMSVRSEYAEQLEQAVEAWAFTHDLPEDDRQLDSLAGTLRDIGHAVLGAIHGSMSSALPRALQSSAAAAEGITLD